ncbi:MAG: N-formylglutamate amidohydrolase [Gammaproteobacteria bacterium]|jgi:predicted N-formylglutamate amidohydrolase
MGSDTDVTTLPLLAVDEPPAFELVNVQGRSSAVLVCDHAANRVPQRLGSLGLDTGQLASHIAWDPGAAEVARRLADRLDAPLVLSGYSRLVIDCNRPLNSAESIAAQSAGIPVPGNLGLSQEQRARRIHTLFRPYHDAIEQLLASRLGRPSLLLSIHSFTPVWHGKPRPWHIGISCWRERRFAALLRDALATDEAISVGDNQPYPIEDDIDYTIPVHSDAHAIPGVMIEIRQDGIDTAASAEAWAARLAQAYGSIEAVALEGELKT